MVIAKPIAPRFLAHVGISGMGYNVPYVCINKNSFTADSAKADEYCDKFIPNNGEFSSTILSSTEGCYAYNYTEGDDKNILNFTEIPDIDKKNEPSTKGYICRLYRNKYKADPSECCKKGKIFEEVIDGNTCDPIYRGFTTDCNQYNKSYCKKDDYLFKNSHCIDWCNEQKDACNTLKYTLCNDSAYFALNREDCLDVCKENSGECDDVMKPYCENISHKNEDICKCLNIDNSLRYVPNMCNDDCIHKGYKDKNSLIPPICPVTLCNIVIGGADNTSLKVDDNTAVNNCGNPDSTKEIISVDLNKEWFSSDKRFRNLEIMIPGIIFIIIVFFIFIWLIYLL